MLGETLASTRGRISPWRSVEAGWPALERWLRAVERGVLFPRVRPWPRGAPWRVRAERVAATAIAFAPTAGAGSLSARAFAGAALAARA